jgi:predicted dehydrogenase
MNSRIEDIPVLIAGCGSIGRRHGRVLSSLGIRSIDICDPSSGQREAMKSEIAVRGEFENLTDHLLPFQAVFICTLQASTSPRL